MEDQLRPEEHAPLITPLEADTPLFVPAEGHVNAGWWEAFWRSNNVPAHKTEAGAIPNSQSLAEDCPFKCR